MDIESAKMGRRRSAWQLARSDDSVIPCHNSIAIDVSSHMKLMSTRTDSPRFDSALRNKG